MSRYVRCTQLTKPGMGTIHIHRRLWWPWRAQLAYQPEGVGHTYPIPPELFGEFSRVTSSLEAMALLRREEQP